MTGPHTQLTHNNILLQYDQQYDMSMNPYNQR